MSAIFQVRSHFQHFRQELHNCVEQFEYIYVKTDIEKTIRLGKSYGEAVLMEYGIKYSELLKEEEFIYKCTGRVLVKNINSLIHKEKNIHTYY